MSASRQQTASLGDLRPGQIKPQRRPLTPPPARRKNPARGKPLRGLLYAVALLCLPAVVLLPLRWINPPVSSYMLQSETPLESRHWVDYDTMGRHLALAAIASEDQKFPHHPGFDFDALAKVLSAPGGPTRGASTISQQTSKNLLLWPGGYVRKALEAWITLWMEVLWPKARILEVYLNIVEFGPGVYGVWAGARHHFGLDPTRLSRMQAGQMIALLPSPRRYAVNDEHVLKRAAWIVAQMDQLGPDHLPD